MKECTGFLAEGRSPLNTTWRTSPKSRRVSDLKSARLVEVRPDEELPADFCVSLRRILVPTALEKASAVALHYASALARRFGSELALFYAFEGSDYDQSSCVETKLWACLSTIRLRHPKVRVFLRPGPTGEQVKTVANALGADLIVSSHDYHRRFLSYLTQAETGILTVQGIRCPVVLVNALLRPRGTDLVPAHRANSQYDTKPASVSGCHFVACARLL